MSNTFYNSEKYEAFFFIYNFNSIKIKSIMWNRRKLNETFPNNDIALQWCFDNGFIPSQKLCNTHRTPMILEKGHGKFGRFVCNKGSCKSQNRISCTTGTWFENVKLEIPTVFR